MSTTTDLSKFGYRELEMLEKLLTALREKGLPEGFDQIDVHPMMNQNSGEVFLTNYNHDVAMTNGGKLELWHTCHYCGHEGFFEDFEHEAKNEECNQAMDNAGIPI